MLALQKKKSLKLIISVSNSKIRVKKHEKLKARERIKEIIKIKLLQEGGPIPGPKRGLLSNTRKWTVQGATHADKARDFIGKACLGIKQEGKATQGNYFATWLRSSGFIVMGLISRLSLANYSDSGSFLVVHASLSQDGSHQEEFSEVVGHRVSPLDLPWPLSMGGGLVPYCNLLS